MCDMYQNCSGALQSGAARLTPKVPPSVVRDSLCLCCRVCPFMLRALHYALAKAHALQPGWLALRVSYGMNGVLLRVRKTLNPELSLHPFAALQPLLGVEDPSAAQGGMLTHFHAVMQSMLARMGSCELSTMCLCRRQTWIRSSPTSGRALHASRPIFCGGSGLWTTTGRRSRELHDGDPHLQPFPSV